jgi:catechol 2,3-dioxygenase-like lactoylglutathione lyase family enzyme
MKAYVERVPFARGRSGQRIRHRGGLPVCVFLLLGLSTPITAHAGGFAGVQINVPDPQAAAQWYATHLGGRITTAGAAAAVAFGKVTISFAKTDATIGESRGSGIDHLGFSYENLDAAMQKFARAGVRIVSGIEKDGPVRYAFIHDPWSTLIEVVEDPEIQGFHHIHLVTKDPKLTLRWYQDVFGGKFDRFAGLIGGIRYGKTWILVKGTRQPPLPTKGRAIDHVSWPVDDFAAQVQRLRAQRAVIEAEPREAATARSRFAVGPDGVRLEIVRRVSP